MKNVKYCIDSMFYVFCTICLSTKIGDWVETLISSVLLGFDFPYLPHWLGLEEKLKVQPDPKIGITTQFLSSFLQSHPLGGWVANSHSSIQLWIDQGKAQGLDSLSPHEHAPRSFWREDIWMWAEPVSQPKYICLDFFQITPSIVQPLCFS